MPSSVCPFARSLATLLPHPFSVLVPASSRQRPPSPVHIYMRNDEARATPCTHHRLSYNHPFSYPAIQTVNQPTSQTSDSGEPAMPVLGTRNASNRNTRDDSAFDFASAVALRCLRHDNAPSSCYSRGTKPRQRFSSRPCLPCSLPPALPPSLSFFFPSFDPLAPLLPSHFASISRFLRIPLAACFCPISYPLRPSSSFAARCEQSSVGVLSVLFPSSRFCSSEPSHHRHNPVSAPLSLPGGHAS